MADIAAKRTAHATLAGGTVDVVTLGASYPLVEVLSRDGAAEIYFTTDGSVPKVGAPNTFVLPAAIGSVQIEAGATGGGGTVVKLISSGTPAYSITGLRS